MPSEWPKETRRASRAPTLYIVASLSLASDQKEHECADNGEEGNKTNGHADFFAKIVATSAAMVVAKSVSSSVARMV